ncbi:MAG: hypothetical protein K8T91_21460 [Planctomycetes bacterium]|nr:hypothetical protein [Planctomycetota bacterium]
MNPDLGRVAAAGDELYYCICQADSAAQAFEEWRRQHDAQAFLRWQQRLSEARKSLSEALVPCERKLAAEAPRNFTIPNRPAATTAHGALLAFSENLDGCFLNLPDNEQRATFEVEWWRASLRSMQWVYDNLGDRGQEVARVDKTDGEKLPPPTVPQHLGIALNSSGGDAIFNPSQLECRVILFLESQFPKLCTYHFIASRRIVTRKTAGRIGLALIKEGLAAGQDGKKGIALTEKGRALAVELSSTAQ